MALIKGYRAIGLPIVLDNSSVLQFIYLKEHVEKSTSDISIEQKKKSGKALFVGNVDLVLDMSHEDIDQYLRLLLSRYGDITEISISNINNRQQITSRFAHVTFAKKSSSSAALNASDLEYLDAGKEISNLFAIKKEVKSAEEIREMYSFVSENPSELKAEVDQFMNNFEDSEKAERMAAEKRATEADEDGFIPVKSRYFTNIPLYFIISLLV
jgi:RNA recognition motif-containing protein